MVKAPDHEGFIRGNLIVVRLARIYDMIGGSFFSG